MYKKPKQKNPYQLVFRDVKRIELFTINAPFWNRQEAIEYANNRLQEEKKTFKAVYSVLVKRITNKNY